MTEETEHPPGRLLFVDDEANILSALNRVFRQQGYEIHLAESGKAGLEILESNTVDVVISDMRMPNMSGAEFLAEVCKRFPDTARILLTGFSDIDATVEAINLGKIFAYASKPWKDHDIRLTIEQALNIKRLRDERDDLQLLTVKQNRELRALNATLEDKVRERTRELDDAHQRLKESYYAAIPVFAGMIQLREGDNAGLSKQTADLARMTALQIGLNEDQVRDVYFASLLHDVGKLGLPDEILCKPEGRLTFPERDKLRKHPVIGQAVLMSMEPLQTAATIIRHQNERYDGKGNPDRLHGTKIPVGSRILSVAKGYVGMVSGTSTGQAFSAADATRELTTSRAFDANIVTEFISMLDARGELEGSYHEKRLNPDELEPGMMLSRNLTSSEGLMLLSQGYSLNPAMIERVKSFALHEGENFLVHVMADQ